MAASPQADYTQEVRFAIVMYGGVSLAIYINGIAQELLRLVRSTARKQHADFNGTERIYRKVSYLLADESMSMEELDKASADTNSASTHAICSGHPLRNFSRRHQRHLPGQGTRQRSGHGRTQGSLGNRRRHRNTPQR